MLAKNIVERPRMSAIRKRTIINSRSVKPLLFFINPESCILNFES
jgi:hypothetical protein